MILADKIINERKRNGWSQEELAEKLSVSRQAVSKWESAQSVPDIQRVIQMAALFGVSTDYLLKDELELPEVIETTEYDYNNDSEVRVVSLEEANEFLDIRLGAASKIALGVALCIMCPALLIILVECSETMGLIPEAVAVGTGLVVMFGMIAAAVYTFIMTGMRLRSYEFLEKELIETAYGVKGMVTDKKKNFQDAFSRGIAIGVILCIVAVIPIVIAGVSDASDFVCAIMAALLLIVIAAGVFTIVNVSIIMGSYNMLLQEGDYTAKCKKDNKKLEPVSGIYWCTVTAIYLGWSFISGRWDMTWIIWPVMAVLFGAITGIYKCLSKD